MLIKDAQKIADLYFLGVIDAKTAVARLNTVSNHKWVLDGKTIRIA